MSTIQNIATAAITDRAAARELRKAAWYAEQDKRAAEWTALKACSFVTDQLPAVGAVIDHAELGTVRVVTIGRFGRIYCEPVKAEAPKPVAAPKHAKAKTPKLDSAAFWQAVRAANSAFPGYAPRAETPRGFRKLTFINMHGVEASVRQPATFRCPPARFWPGAVLPVGVVAPIEDARTDLEQARTRATLAAENLARWIEYTEAGRDAGSNTQERDATRANRLQIIAELRKIARKAQAAVDKMEGVAA